MKMTANFDCIEFEKFKFLRNEFFLMSWLAAVQRNKTFKTINEVENKQTYENKKGKFRKEIQKTVYSMLLMYAETTVSKGKHHENISKLLEIAKKDEYKEIFDEIPKAKDKNHNPEYDYACFNTGTAQKLLNMMLKYCWCAGWITMPPEMPIDRRNLDFLEKNTNKNDFKYNWTDINKIEDYEKHITEIETVVTKPLAIWELENWTRVADEI